MINPKQIMKEVEEYFGLDKGAILKMPPALKQGARKEARSTFISLCRQYTRYSCAEIAEALNITNQIVYEAQRNIKAKKSLQNLYNNVEHKLRTKYSDEL